MLLKQTATTLKWSMSAMTEKDYDTQMSIAKSRNTTDIQIREIHKTGKALAMTLSKMMGGGLNNLAKRSTVFLPVILSKTMSVAYGGVSGTFATDPSSKIRSGFSQILSIATAISEPILWFYALTACIMMATGRSKQMGWERLKNVGYAYIMITMMPTIFAFLRWIATILGGAMQF